MEKKCDCLVVGLGPAGVSACIYLKRSSVDVLGIDKGEIGGKLNSIKEIENYPSYIGSGEELAKKMKDQIDELNVPYIRGKVSTINQEDDGFLVMTSEGDIKAKSVIVSSGILEKPYKVIGSDSYFGNGISRCAECDAAFYKNKPVGVYIEDEHGVKEAIYLSDIVESVYLVVKADYSSFSADIREKVAQKNNISVYSDCEIIDSKGARHIEQIVLSNGETLKVDGLFLFIGASPISDFLGYLDVIDAKGFIKVDQNMKTSVPGFFAAGDISNTNLRQVVSAVSDGAKAAISARAYLKTLK